MSDAPFPRNSSSTVSQAGSTKRKSASQDEAPLGPAISIDEGIFGSSAKRAKRIEVVQDKKKGKDGKKGKKEGVISSGISAASDSNVGLGMVRSEDGKLTRIDMMKHSVYVPGAQALGYVLQITSHHVVVSLPGGLTGTVPAHEISDHTYRLHSALGSKGRGEKAEKVVEPSKLLAQNQQVHCVVLENTSPVRDGSKAKRNIVLSLRASLVNKGLAFKHLSEGFPLYGCITSREDHGYIISSGYSAINIFLPSKSVPQASNDLVVGSPVQCVVASVNEGSRTAVVKIAPKAVANARVTNAALPFLAVTSGALLDVIIEKVVQNGLVVRYLSSFRGAIDSSSLPRAVQPDGEWQSSFSEGSVLQARVVFVDHGARSVRLSLRPHVLQGRVPPQLPPLGSTLRALRVISVRKKVGVLLAQDADEEDSGCRVFIHKSDLEDPQEGGSCTADRVAKAYRAGREVAEVRVRGYHLVEGWVLASNLPKFLDSEVVHKSHVKVGQSLAVEIAALGAGGMLLLVGGSGVQASCPLLHASDVGLSSLANGKFKVGQKLTMKVWDVKPSGSGIVMTNKKSLLDLDAASQLQTYSGAVVGDAYSGVVAAAGSQGLRVAFFGGVVGTVPMAVLVKQGVPDAEEAYRPGQVVRCVVLGRSEGKKPRLTLALDMGKRKELVEAFTRELSGGKDVAAAATSTSGGAVVSGEVTKVSEELVVVRLDDGRVAHLHMLQCYDFAKTAVAVFNSTKNPFTEGSRVEGALVLSITKNIVNLSLKPLLLASQRGASDDTILPESFSELIPGQVLAGYVHKVESYGVLVRFRGGLTALAPRPNIADKFISSPEGLYFAGDSVRCVVQSTDAVRDRAIVSLKPRAVDSSQGDGAGFLEALLRERHIAASMGAGNLPDLEKFAIGSLCDATVKAIERDFALLTASDGSTSIKVPLALVAKPLKRGAAVRTRLLDVDYAERILLGSLTDSALAGSSLKKAPKQAPTPPAPGATVAGTVELLRGAYAVVAVEGRVAYVQVADFHCPFLDAATELAVGAHLSGRVLRCGAAGPHGGVVLLTASAQPSKAAISAPAQTKQKFLDNLHVGSILKWVVAEVGALELKVQPQGWEEFGFSVQASIPLCAAVGHKDATDDLEAVLQRAAKSGVGGAAGVHALHPFYGIAAGQVLAGRVLQFRRRDGSDDLVVFVSLEGKPAAADAHCYKLLQWSGKNAAREGSVHAGVVTKVDAASCTVQLSPYISAKMSHMDVSSEASLVKAFKRSCFVGLRVVVAIVQAGGAHGSKRVVKISRACAEQVASGRTSLDLTQLLPAELSTPPAELKVGDIVMGMLDLRAAWTPRPPALVVSLPGGKQGRVCVTEVADPAAWRDLSAFFASKRETEAQADSCFPYDFTSGSVVKCRVLDVAGDTVELSLRAARLAKRGLAAEDAMPAEGDVVSAYVANTDTKGCFLRLGRSLSGRALMKDLSDDYVAEPGAALPCGKLVQAKLLRLNEKTRQADLSLRVSDIAGDTRAAAELDALVVGDSVRGTVLRVTAIGVFVAIEGTSIVGLSRRAAAAAPNVEDLGALFEEGDVVRAKVLSVAKSSKKVALGLKPSYFSKDTEDEDDDDDDEDKDDDDEEEDEDEDEEDDDDDGDKDEEDDDDDDDDDGDKDNEDDDDDGDEDNEDDDDDDDDKDDDVNEGINMLGEDDGSDDSEIEAMIQGSLLPYEEDEEDEEEKAVTKKAKSEQAPHEDSEDDSEDEESRQGPLGPRAVAASTGLFSWSDFRPAAAARVEDSDSDVDGAEQGELKRKRSKESKRALEEQQVHAKEMAIWEGSHRPESAQDFERLLLEDPDSSVTWIQYMALHLADVSVDGARSVAERALKKINFRREDDKFNVWVAYLNLEKQFGSPASFDAVFARAAVESKGKYVHLKVCQILEEAGSAEACVDMFERTLKKFKYSKKVWMAYQHFRLRQQQDGAAKELLARSMQSLSKHKHVEVITKYALAEFESGSPDRARVLFEELLSNYPKRTDLWHVFIDKEIKLQNVAQARNLFRRMTTLKTSAKNIKNIFKKFVAFEQNYGSEASVNEVKVKARDYVNSMMA